MNLLKLPKGIPSGKLTYIAIENDPFIVYLPIKNGDFPSFFVSVPEGNDRCEHELCPGEGD